MSNGFVCTSRVKFSGERLSRCETGPASADKDLSAMNVTVNVDLTPSEARELMGLPDLKPLQTAAMARIEQTVMKQADSFSADGLMNTWFAGSPKAAEMLGDMVGGLFSQGRAREKPAAKPKEATRE
jgi:Family of unknown function (DUF6489)